VSIYFKWFPLSSKISIRCSYSIHLCAFIYSSMAVSFSSCSALAYLPQHFLHIGHLCIYHMLILYNVCTSTARSNNAFSYLVLSLFCKYTWNVFLFQKLPFHFLHVTLSWYFPSAHIDAVIQFIPGIVRDFLIRHDAPYIYICLECFLSCIIRSTLYSLFDLAMDMKIIKE
jgi:hypothetical protein